MIKVGADPELFVFDKNQQFISGFGLIPGSKHQPYKVPNGAVQVDGMAVEFNIDPAATEDSFVRNIQSVMKTLNKMVEKQGEAKPVSLVRFAESWFAQQPMPARELGCEPDYNAYLGRENTPPDEDVLFRTAAGHVHIGWRAPKAIDRSLFLNAMSTAKNMDALVGLPSVLLDPEGAERRELYGRAGSFRPKPYGCEYRVLSNFWLKDESLMRWVFKSAVEAAECRGDGDHPGQRIPWDTLETVINTNNKRAAEAIIQEYGITMP